MKQLKSFYFYRKIITAFVLLNMISTIGISIILSGFFLRSSRKEQRETLKAAVSGVDTVMDSLYDNILPTVNYVLTFKNAGNFMNTDHVDRVLEAKLLNDLNRLEIADSRVNYIGLVNLSAGRYIGTRGVYSGIEPEILNCGKSGRILECFSRKISLNANIDSSPRADVLTFVYRPGQVYKQGLIVIDITLDSLLETMPLTDSVHMFIAKDGELLMSSLAENGSDEDILQIVPDMEDKTPWYAIKSVAGKSFEIAAAKTESFGFTIVCYRTGAGIGPAMRNIVLPVLLIDTLLLLAGGTVSFFMAARVYKPLGQLYRQVSNRRNRGKNLTEQAKGYDDSVNEIEIFGDMLKNYEEHSHVLEKYTKDMSGNLSNYWLKGLARGEIAPSLEEIPDQCIYAFEEGCYRVVLLWMAHYSQYEDAYSVKDRGIIEFAMGNILGEIVDGCESPLIRTDKNCWMFLLKCRPGEISETVLLGIKDVQKNFIKYMNLTVNLCIGPCIGNWRQIPESYKSAVNGRKKQIFLGEGCIIDAEYDYGRHSSEYPYKAVSRLGSLIAAGNREQGIESLGELFGRLERMDADDIIRTTVKSCFELTEKYSRPGSRLREYSYEALQALVSRMESMDEVKSLLTAFSEQLFKENEKADHPDDESYVQAAVAYIGKNFSDGNLNVEKIADVIGITSSYFGKLFAREMHQSCIDYIQEVRMENAAALLKETPLPVKEISLKVGVSNVNYFYSLFKKKYSMTPVQYRRSVREEKKDVE